MNDPCGCMALPDGRYLMGFQHAPGWPEDPAVGWGLAESRDLVHWTERPSLILPPDETGWAYSGSTIIDAEGVAGFGAGALLAFHTRHQPGRQRQHVAVSTDMGDSWASFPTPVIDEGRADSRDPFVCRWGGEYRLLLARPVAWSAPGEGRSTIAVYRSPDLRTWTHLGDLGVTAPANRLIECPALLPGVAVEGGGAADILLVSLVDRTGGQALSRVEAHIGRFDGARFHGLQPPTLLTQNPDFYAATPFANLPPANPLIIAWSANWNTARSRDFGGWWGGPMTAPMRLSLRRDGAALEVALTPVVEAGREARRSSAS